MRVDVEGEACVGMAQKFLDVLGVHALPREERGARVAEVVEADGGQTGALEEGLRTL